MSCQDIIKFLKIMKNLKSYSMILRIELDNIILATQSCLPNQPSIPLEYSLMFLNPI